jgi:hypothetical protein
MTSDSVVSMVRQVTLIIGTILVTLHWATGADVSAASDAILTVVGGTLAFASIVHNVYTKWATKSVPLATAERSDVPTINPVTGSQVPGPAFQG